MSDLKCDILARFILKVIIIIIVVVIIIIE